MKKLKYVWLILILTFFIIFIYNKYYLENRNIIKIPPKSIFSQWFVKPANLENLKNDKNKWYVPFIEINNFSWIDTKKIDNPVYYDGGKYFNIVSINPFLKAKIWDVFSIVIDWYLFKGEVVSVDKYIYDQKLILIKRWVKIDKAKKYDYNYSKYIRISLNKNNNQDYISISANSVWEILWEIVYVPISWNWYRFMYKNWLWVFMTTSDYNKSWWKMNKLEEDIKCNMK